MFKQIAKRGLEMKKHILYLTLALMLSNVVYAAETVVITTPARPSKTLEWQTGEPGRMQWQAAMNYCRNLTLDDKNDWRLPNIDELETLVDRSKYKPAANKSTFPNLDLSYYWSSTTSASNTGYAWFVYFYYGGVGDGPKSSNNFVRCVRGGQ